VGDLDPGGPAETVADLIDQFAAEYKWPSTVTWGHTFFQLTSLTDAIAERKVEERQAFAETVRMATQAKAEDYERWFNGLEEALYDEEDAAPGPASVSLPRGFVYQREK
jgi:hypothetical protein